MEPVFVPFAIILVIAVGASIVARGSVIHPSPLQAPPTIESCEFFPDPRVNTSFVCGTNNGFQPAFVNASLRFRVNVSGTTNLNVTFFFDYIVGNGSVNPDSPTRTISVPSPGFGVNATVETNWTYPHLNANFSSGTGSSRYWVHVEVQDDFGQTGIWSPPFFPVIVNANSEPYLIGLNSVNSGGAINSQTRQIPLLYVNVSAVDPDADPLTVTWDWGDGERSVNVTGPTVNPVAVNATHRYAVDRFPLNETPRYMRFPITVWVDDGVGHNNSSLSSAEFYIEIDSPPTVDWDKPAVGSVWKVGEPVPMVANVTDPDVSTSIPCASCIVYWDFDNRTDSDRDGNPTNDRDANGTTASHEYAAPGDFGITLWATDGEDKKFCLDQVNCTSNATGYRSHWVNQSIPIHVRLNTPPILAVSDSSAIKGDSTQLVARVYDLDGDSMHVTWDFGDGTPGATNITPTSPRESPALFEVIQTHTYEETGPHNLTITVSDGNDTVNDTREVFVESFNEPPVFLGIQVLRAGGSSAGNNTFLIGATVVANVTVYDFENDTVDVRVDWRDGNVTVASVDPKTAQNCTLDSLNRTLCWASFSHAYGRIGTDAIRRYTVLVTITDHQVYIERNSTGGNPIVRSHTKTQTVIVFIVNPQAQGLGPWDWWDYSTFAAVIGIPVALVGRWAYLVHKERKEG